VVLEPGRFCTRNVQLVAITFYHFSKVLRHMKLLRCYDFDFEQTLSTRLMVQLITWGSGMANCFCSIFPTAVNPALANATSAQASPHVK
jgi:hypothetical protein